MAVSDIASLVVSRILYEAGNVNRSIAESDVAEPGPPTGVQRFSGADASAGALMAKLGARVFQRARERRAANQKAEKDRLDEQYRRAQIEKMVAASQPDPTEAVTVGGRTFNLKPEAAANLVARMGERKPDEKLLTTDPDTGKPLATPMKMSEWLTMRGQNMTDRRAAEGRALTERLVRERKTATASDANERANLTASLGTIPSDTDTFYRAQAQATAEVDSIYGPAKPGKTAKKVRDDEIARRANEIYRRAKAQQDSTAAPLVRRLRSMAVNDSTAAANGDFSNDPVFQQVRALLGN